MVVDDYDLVATSMGNPLTPFADLVNQSQDIGLHLVIVRSMGGAGRTVFSDPIVARMKDAQMPALIMSGTKDEGALFSDVKPSPLPPGRATLVNRSGKVMVQMAHLDHGRDPGQQPD
ncbi:hypothetical protein [Aestuariimicrobium kwangyangense]|uniref:hypothetical protein n=1 Tax=Aestuariimicrobium kwangyangense TaxID=396389 RepID=UPI00146ADC7C|nr:hypothetical protein [Aestuariimicrobium kwangyangense]